jgi:hypothetical protein
MKGIKIDQTKREKKALKEYYRISDSGYQSSSLLPDVFFFFTLKFYYFFFQDGRGQQLQIYLCSLMNFLPRHTMLLIENNDFLTT